MRISVIIPTYNEEKTIKRTLDALMRYGDDLLEEIIVVDGKSEDKTVDIASELGARVMVSDTRSRAAQMNEGARKANGNLLYFVHADTLVPEGYATDIIQAMKEGWKMGNFRYDFDKDSFLLSLNAYFTKYSWLVTQGGDKTFFILKDLFFELGAYDTYWTIMEEYDFVKRADKAGHAIITLPKKCIVSARKYHHNSWLRVQIANFVVFNLWKLGLAGPDKLKAVYGKILK
ncbi:MAG: TIGR04283 family arsenosugar biosynthesis glycosyltransferase [Saprospiraceae bacterium]|nr:TIGR04283 family arsenosugar biosynthesis glycosyltransferase [Saprospiraceae bacterium]